MSMINDALKRAKLAQTQTPPPSVHAQLELRPVEPMQSAAGRGNGVIVPVVLAVGVLLIMFFAWQWVGRPQTAPPMEARAQTAQSAAAADSGHSSASATPQFPAPAPVLSAEPVATNSAAAQVPPPAPATNVVPAVEEPPVPKAPPMTLKLQGVVFSRTRPSAMVNGKTLFLGERIGDYRLVAVTSDTATLVCAGFTNVLSLVEQ